MDHTPDEVLNQLIEGNRRFVAGRPTQVISQTPIIDRLKLAREQHPHAIVVSCSDSRVLPELVFDQGLGSIFVVRNAGHACDDVALGSIEYAIEHFHCPLILVLGHERCGAVTAAVEGGEAPDHIAAVVNAIQPALEGANSREHAPLHPGVDWAVVANAQYVADQLRDTRLLAQRIGAGVLAASPRATSSTPG